MTDILSSCKPWLAATLFTTLVCSQSGQASGDDAAGGLQRCRLIVMADMGNEPDEEQQMVHLLMYANRIDLEGLIACSGKYLHADRTDGRVQVRPDLFHKLVDGYAEVVRQLGKHEGGWPTADYLRSIIKAGSSEYGIEAVSPGRSNEASKLIEAAILKDDPRKLYIVGNAGTNTLAQALVDLDESRSRAEMDRLCARVIVFENGAQDNSGAWIAERYPRIAWHRSNHQTYGYGGPGSKETIQGPYTWEPFSRSAAGQHDWARQHIMTEHGALGACFPPRLMGRLHFIEGGGTIPWMGLVNRGLADPEHLFWGGWSGRFSRTRHRNVYSRHEDVRRAEREYGDFFMFEADCERETWTDPVHRETFNNHFVPVWRFRRAMLNEFQARMDWCVQEFTEANHNPIAAFDGDGSDAIVRLQADPGQQLTLDASASTDPDEDELNFRWWVYREAGTYSKDITIPRDTAPITSVTIPDDARGCEIHIILEVRDRSRVIPLYDYRRVIVDVGPRLFRIDTKSPAELRHLLQFDGRTLPLVSAHRGGGEPGFPENCLETFENTLRHTFSILEIDLRYTQDGQIIIHHDLTLDRTTNGTGPVAERTLQQIKQLCLKDPQGNVTEFQIPTLDEVLEWARGRTIVILDKKDVPVEACVRKIQQHHAEAYAMVMAYSFSDVQQCHTLNREIMMEVMIGNRRRFQQFQDAGVPWSRVVVFVGHTPPEDPGLLKMIHAKGACCMAGTSRNLDRQLVLQSTDGSATMEREYRALLANGVDIIETDLPIRVARLLFRDTAVRSSKAQYFQTR